MVGELDLGDGLLLLVVDLLALTEELVEGDGGDALF